MEKLTRLKEEHKKYAEKLAHKMKGYRGVVHESASSELKHSEVMVLKSIVRGLENEIDTLEKELRGKKK
jgi:uncharacterized coiled-coil DUF342 family protein